MDFDFASAAKDFIQAERILRIETPLGLDALLPENMELTERINGLFEMMIAVRSKRTDLKAEELVGQLVDVSLETGEGVRRTWNGLVIALTEGPPVTRGMRSYRLTVVPQHWLMTQRSDCRIWLDKTAVEVAEILCSEHGLHAPVTAGVVTPPKPQHYSVQWNETDLAYLTRRLEEDGIFFWFEHEGGSPGSVAAKHTLHIASDGFGYTRSDDADVRFAMGSTDRNHISKFEKTFRFVPGKRSAGDWNFLQPNGVPRGETPSLVNLPGNANYDLYEYPAIGGYGTGSASDGIKSDQVEAQSKLRMQAAEAEHEKIDGQSTIRTLAPGRRFKPYDVANPANVFDEQVVVEIKHFARDRSYETSEDVLEYVNTFSALPSRVPATPHRSTPRPRIDGTQIAIIAGPEGEEIHTDSHARVKVWFPWDRRAKKDGSDTCWIRVTQNWAGGSTYGGQIVPRIKMEAVISYIDGDPDKPLITGIVPNPNSKLPYTFPENKTRSTFRTNTHKGSGFNEFTFEDKTGEENMFYHAQKDHTTRVLNTRTASIGSHSVETIGGNQVKTIEANEKRDVGGSLHVSVGGTGRFAQAEALRHKQMADVTAHIIREAARASGQRQDVEAYALAVKELLLGFFEGKGVAALDAVTGGENPRADAGSALSKSGNQTGDAAANLFDDSGVLNTFVARMQSDTVGIARVEQIGDTKVTNVGKSRQINVGKKEVKTIGETQETHVGDHKAINVGKTFDIEVGERFSIKVGGNSFVMDSEGNISIRAAKTSVVRGGGAQFTIGPGPILYTPVLVKGASPGPGAPGVPKKTRKPFAEECQDDGE